MDMDPALKAFGDCIVEVLSSKFQVSPSCEIQVNAISYMESSFCPDKARLQLIEEIRLERKVAMENIDFCVELNAVKPHTYARIEISDIRDGDEPLWSEEIKHVAVSPFYDKLPRAIKPLHSGGIGIQLQSILVFKAKEFLTQLAHFVNGGSSHDSLLLARMSRSIAATVVTGGSLLTLAIDSEIADVYAGVCVDTGFSEARFHISNLRLLEGLLELGCVASRTGDLSKRFAALTEASKITAVRSDVHRALEIQAIERDFALGSETESTKFAATRLISALSEPAGADGELVARLVYEEAVGNEAHGLLRAVRSTRQSLCVAVGLASTDASHSFHKVLDSSTSSTRPSSDHVSSTSSTKPPTANEILQLPTFFIGDRNVTVWKNVPCPLRNDITSRFSLNRCQRSSVRLLLAIRELLDLGLGRWVSHEVLKQAANRSMQQSILALERISTAVRLNVTMRGLNVHHPELGLNAVLGENSSQTDLCDAFNRSMQMVKNVSSDEIVRFDRLFRSDAAAAFAMNRFLFDRCPRLSLLGYTSAGMACRACQTIVPAILRRRSLPETERLQLHVAREVASGLQTAGCTQPFLSRGFITGNELKKVPIQIRKLLKSAAVHKKGPLAGHVKFARGGQTSTLVLHFSKEIRRHILQQT